MKNLFAITMMVMAVAAMGPGCEMGASSRVNPPSAADVDAAQAARPDPAPNDAATPSGLHILEAANTTPEEFLWQARPVVVFADTAADPAFLMQIKALQDLPKPLIDRDVVVITDTDPAAGSAWRRQVYWAVPLAVSAFFSWLMVLISRTSNVEPEPASYSMYLILLLGPFALQLAMASFVFRCEACGWCGNTYRTWWRKGTFWCPHCSAHYQDGKRLPE